MRAGANGLAVLVRMRGATLVYVLCLLIVILLLGVSAAQMAMQGEKAARGERDRHVAFQAAEEALMDAQHDIEGLPGAPGRSSLFASTSAAGFSAGCGDAGADGAIAAADDDDEPGLCLPAEPGAPALWLSMELDAADAASGTGASHAVPYGQFTGAFMRTGQGYLPSRPPRYVIELLPFHPAGAEAGAAPGSIATGNYIYRITAIGFGAQERSHVVLQTYYRKQAGAGP